MQLPDVMRQAMAWFAPNDMSMQAAVTAAVEAGERFILGSGLGIAKGSINKDALLQAAIEVWNNYSKETLEALFVVTHVSREDLIRLGATKEQALSLSDGDMLAIANRVGDTYVGDGDCWVDLKYATDWYLEKVEKPKFELSEVAEDKNNG